MTMTNKEAIEFIRARKISTDKWSYNEQEAIEIVLRAVEKLDEIIKILDDTDFNNAVSLNADGEDKGYSEAICEISVVADGQERWMR